MFDKIMKCNISLLAFLSILIAGCGAYERARPIEVKQPVKPIFIGVAPQTPPYIFREGKKTVGIEADFAKELANKIDIPMQFVEMPFEGLIPALINGKIDIIMSGMSITKARQLRVRFTKPYMTNGLMTLMRSSDSQIYTSQEKIFNTTRNIGVIKGTTADTFARLKCPKATIATYLRAEDVVRGLRQQQISLYIDDGPVIAWLLSKDASTFSALFVPLTKEYTAWAVRPDNEELLTTLNAALDDFEKDGTANRILKRWLPYIN